MLTSPALRGRLSTEGFLKTCLSAHMGNNDIIVLLAAASAYVFIIASAPIVVNVEVVNFVNMVVVVNNASYVTLNGCFITTGETPNESVGGKFSL